jgi:cytochrome c biogenesis protein CcmG, thiol:disulfide interchange protein DsbE
MSLRHLLPFFVFLAVAVALGVGLTLKPKDIPSALIDKPIPEFALPPLEGRDNGLASSDLRNGDVQVVNVFASWCLPCRAEHPFLMELAKSGKAALSGINYKDKPEKVAKWLDDLGDPFGRIGADVDGRASIDWGVYGVPETFIVDGAGRIRMKHLGPLNNPDQITAFLECLDQVKKGEDTCGG